MEKENLEDLFKNLQGQFDTEEPVTGHQERFFAKLNSNSDKTVSLSKTHFNWWKPLSIAASLALLVALVYGQLDLNPSLEEQVADISPEVANTQFYFASLIEQQVKELEAEESPETKKIISDTMDQLKKLERDYKILENELLEGGNSKLILSAMITNFQTRIDLLNDVLNQIETIKNLKKYDDENFTI
ncbi:hypothetical protein [Maribacter cobaltidurans]|uniref:Uncharacterized protein n=1 Tax=Maribacter cobaltidurans TaxID=1178778 RepID=A0A223V853_9FLAO|nr:hypothetical protein [Maribacter cobaltidurans]ASV31417.1 hypothetical protein CJ263_14980 [Maribacter cobaltidurans]GGD82421.1 hypothetical protein GCM10011412_20280 [Maribacter cobaltidurans]